jgi:hypothetical protein
MSISGGRSRKSGGAVLLGAVASLALVLAACGGGDGGGGGGDATEYEIQVAIANETTEQMTIRLDDGEPQTLETCTGNVFIFNLPATDWVVYVNDQPAIDSLDLDPNYLDKNLVANLWLHEDGTLEVERVQPGSNIQKPAKPSICT